MSGSTRRRTLPHRAAFGATTVVAAVSLLCALTPPGLASADPAGASPGQLTITTGEASPRAVSVATRQLALGYQRAGTYYGRSALTVKNTGGRSVNITGMKFDGGNVSDFVVGTSCLAHGHPTALGPGQSCLVKVIFTPRASGARSATLSIDTSDAASPHLLTVRGIGVEGYYLAGRRGGIAHFGDAVFHGDRGGKGLAQPIVSITTTNTGTGYWLLGSDGGIFTFGNAKFYGSTGALHLNKPVVGMTGAPGDKGYWLVASDGGIFTFGNAKFYGSTGGMHINQPIVAMAATRTGKGYWLVARDGGIFTFGDAKFFGSAGASSRSQPIVGMATTPSGLGYWCVARNGRVFAFGDAKMHGADGSHHLGFVAGMAATSDGRGFWLSTTTGRVYEYGDASHLDDLHANATTGVLGLAATAPSDGPRGSQAVVVGPNITTLNARMAALARLRAIRVRSG